MKNIIKQLEPNQIFVFGSNLAGKHVGGAALQAKNSFGAWGGIGEGLTGQCCAFPTLNADFSKRTLHQLLNSVNNLIAIANNNKDKIFLLTKVGCGIAGFPEEVMKEVFNQPLPKNIIKPEDWR